MPTFHNEPPTDFAIDANRQAMQAALSEVRAQLGRGYPLWIDGQAIEATHKNVSLDPSQNPAWWEKSVTPVSAKSRRPWRAAPNGIARVVGYAGRRPRGIFDTSGGRHASPALRVGGVGSLRVRQAVARSRRRRSRGDRLL